MILMNEIKNAMFIFNDRFKSLRYALLSLPILAILAFSLNRNAGSTSIIPTPAVDISVATASGKQTAILAGGCFWGVEAVFEHVKGVTDVVSGYSGGDATTANYDRVSSGKTGHAEAVQITYDPTKVTYDQLLQVYFTVAHDPTEVNRQGPDTGSQYRSAIFTTSDEQQKNATAYIAKLAQSKVFRQPIATTILPLNSFYAAETEHQNFIVRNPNYPYVVMYDLPKVEQLRKQFPKLYKS